jgi:GNAT superfamily N-acetyltransferase
MAPSNWVIERLTKKHDRASFHCGQPTLDDWLKLRVGQFEKRDLARTYVAVRKGNSKVLGYYAIANHRVTYGALTADQAKGLPQIDIPVVLLARLAVDRSDQGQGLGELLLVDALRRAQHIGDQVGVRAVEVDAIDELARTFYAKYGFVQLLDDPNHLFLPMQVIRKLNLPPLARL